jgi:hypothetical protein
MNWTIFASSLGVAVIFATAWLQSRYHKERLEVEREMGKNKEESVERFNINKTQIEVLKTRLDSFAKILDEIKDKQMGIEKKIDQLIDVIPKRSTNHIADKG